MNTRKAAEGEGVKEWLSVGFEMLVKDDDVKWREGIVKNSLKGGAFDDNVVALRSETCSFPLSQITTTGGQSDERSFHTFH